MKAGLTAARGWLKSQPMSVFGFLLIALFGVFGAVTASLVCGLVAMAAIHYGKSFVPNFSEESKQKQADIEADLQGIKSQVAALTLKVGFDQ